MRAALFPLWFLAIASLANGVAHPLLSVQAGRYFPGLFTSPLVGVAGLALLRQMALATGDVRLESGAPNQRVQPSAGAIMSRRG